jgi:hypothetical protein
MLPQKIAFGTPRRLPKASQLEGRVVVLDIAFAAGGQGPSFEKVTLPLIDGLGQRLRAWVDHHDHELHTRYAADDRFVLCTKAEHGACPEMITPELVTRVGKVETVVCHTDFDGLASAAKWMRGGHEPYPGCDDDARAIDTRMGKPGPIGERFDRALRARPRDVGLYGVIVRHLHDGLADKGLWEPIDAACRELAEIETETRRAAQSYRVVEPGVAIVDTRSGFERLEKTLLLLIGQERAPVSVVIDMHNVSVAARFDSGSNFVKLFGLAGGMPTRVSLPHSQMRMVFDRLGIPASDQEPFL